MHLLQSNVDLNMIRFWLGHASIATTNGYVEIDLEMKRKTLRSSERLIPAKAKRDAQGAMTTSFSRGWQSCDYVKHDSVTEPIHSAFGVEYGPCASHKSALHITQSSER